MDRGTGVDGALSQLQHAWATFVNSSFVEETLKVAADASAAARAIARPGRRGRRNAIRKPPGEAAQ